LYSSDDLVKLLKQSAIEAVNAGKPVNIVFGKVISSSPLKIQIDQKMILSQMQLVLSRNVTDYTVNMVVNHETENHTHTHTISGGGSASSETHKHEYKGEKAFIVKNALKLNDEVILIQIPGGQKYIVIDRIGG